MSKGVVFDKDSATRIAKAVRKIEGDPTVTSRPPRGTQLVPNTYERCMMCKAQEAMSADNTEYDVKVLEADGTQGITLAVRRQNGLTVASGDVGFLARDSSGQHIFFLRAASAGAGISYQPANSRTLQEVGAQALVSYKDTYDTGSWSTTWDTLGLWKFDSPVSIADLDIGLATLRTGTTASLLWDASGGDGVAKRLLSKYRFAAITEDFTLATVDRAAVEALDVADIDYAWQVNAGAVATAGSNSSITESGVDTNVLDYITLVAGAATVYGFALYWVEWTSFDGTPDDDMFRILTVGDAPATDKPLLTLVGSPTSR